MSIHSYLSAIKDNNPYLKYLWLLNLARRGEKERRRLSDVDCIKRLYFLYSGRFPDLDNPTLFSEKMQWMKLNYRNKLMPIVGDKYAVREYLENLGYAYLLNDLYALYDNVAEFNPDLLPDRFALKASHASGWNLIVKDKSKVNWSIWKKHMKYWLTHDIEWNGREWHYAQMTPMIVCERYLEDDSGALMDYKFYCFDGEPRFVQVNVGRGTNNSTQNYYDLEWNLLPFGKSQPHNPDVGVDPPCHFSEMIQLARDLTKPFPYVRFDLYEVQGRVFFGEFTFFPCSGMPDFIPPEYDAFVGEMLRLPKANI